jgi:SAM-dependent methyltransferase
MPHKFDPKSLNKLEYPERFHEEPFEDLRPLLQLEQVTAVVDLGCGSGFQTFPIAHYSPRTAKIYALDVSPEMIDRLKHNMAHGELVKPLASEDTKKIIPLIIEENKFPIADGVVDIFFNSKVFHEIDGLSEFFTEVKRILKPEGKILIVDWKKMDTPRGPPLAHRIAFEDALKAVQKGGFVVEQSGEIYSSFYYILARKSLQN